MALSVQELIAKFSRNGSNTTNNGATTTEASGPKLPMSPGDFDKFIRKEQHRERVVQVALLKQQDPTPLLGTAKVLRNWLRASQRVEKKESQRRSIRARIRNSFRKSGQSSRSRSVSSISEVSLQTSKMEDQTPLDAHQFIGPTRPWDDIVFSKHESVGLSPEALGSPGHSVSSNSSGGSRSNKQRSSSYFSTSTQSRWSSLSASLDRRTSKLHRSRDDTRDGRRIRPKSMEHKSPLRKLFSSKHNRMETASRQTALFDGNRYNPVSAPNPLFVSGKVEKRETTNQAEILSEPSTVVYDSEYESDGSTLTPKQTVRDRTVSDESTMGLDKSLLLGVEKLAAQKADSVSGSTVDGSVASWEFEEDCTPPTPPPSPSTRHVRKRGSHRGIRRVPKVAEKSRPLSVSSNTSELSLASLPPPPPACELEDDESSHKPSRHPKKRQECKPSRTRKHVLSSPPPQEWDLPLLIEEEENQEEVNKRIDVPTEETPKSRLQEDYEMLRGIMSWSSADPDALPKLLREDTDSSTISAASMERKIRFEAEIVERTKRLHRAIAGFLVFSDPNRFPSRNDANNLVLKYSNDLENLLCAMQHRYPHVPEKWLIEAIRLEIAKQT